MCLRYDLASCGVVSQKYFCDATAYELLLAIWSVVEEIVQDTFRKVEESEGRCINFVRRGGVGQEFLTLSTAEEGDSWLGEGRRAGGEERCTFVRSDFNHVGDAKCILAIILIIFGRWLEEELRMTGLIEQGIDDFRRLDSC